MSCLVRTTSIKKPAIKIFLVLHLYCSCAGSFIRTLTHSVVRFPYYWSLVIKPPKCKRGLYAMALSVCLPVYLSLFICRLSETRTQNAVFIKTSQQLRVVVSIDEVLYMSFLKNRFLDS